MSQSEIFLVAAGLAAIIIVWMLLRRKPEAPKPAVTVEPPRPTPSASKRPPPALEREGVGAKSAPADAAGARGDAAGDAPEAGEITTRATASALVTETPSGAVDVAMSEPKVEVAKEPERATVRAPAADAAGETPKVPPPAALPPDMVVARADSASPPPAPKSEAPKAAPKPVATRPRAQKLDLDIELDGARPAPRAITTPAPAPVRETSRPSPEPARPAVVSSRPPPKAAPVEAKKVESEKPRAPALVVKAPEINAPASEPPQAKVPSEKPAVEKPETAALPAAPEAPPIAPAEVAAPTPVEVAAPAPVEVAAPAPSPAPVEVAAPAPVEVTAPAAAPTSVEVAAPAPAAKPDAPAAKPAGPPSPTAELEAADPRHKAARRLARLLVGEIKLYNEKEVADGRRAKDLYSRLKEGIDLSRETYKQRTPEEIRKQFDYLYDELLRQLCDGDAARLGAGAPSPNPPRA